MLPVTTLETADVPASRAEAEETIGGKTGIDGDCRRSCGGASQVQQDLGLLVLGSARTTTFFWKLVQQQR